jgi:CubicO group peptidase (beta-lactamase class C family)
MKIKVALTLLACIALQTQAHRIYALGTDVSAVGMRSASTARITVKDDSLDTFILSLMKKRQVPGLSIAVIQDGKIVKAKAYGFIDKKGSVPVTEKTLFQAGSISKSVSAVGALALVEKKNLLLDEDINTRLRTWKVPENEFTKDKKVTLRGILSHTAGLTVHGFPGYDVSAPIPTVVQVLDGAAPANTAAVRVNFTPGTQWRYSGGGYTVMQQLMIDVTGKTFPDYMQNTVLGPLNMNESTFEQPLPAAKASKTASGHSGSRAAIDGRWHIYPEMAAAGLWTTPSDLARFAISIQHGFAGKSGSVLSKAAMQEMLTVQKNNDGLGVFLEGEDSTRRFGHGGRDDGFDAVMTAGVETGQGVVIMINANDNSRMMSQIVNAVAAQYHWKGFSVTKPIPRAAAQVSAAELAAFEGRYELENNRMITFLAEGSRLFSLSDGFPDEEFVPLSATQLASTDRDIFITFVPDAKGEVTEFTWKDGNKERKIPRIGPLFIAPKNVSDPDPSQTKLVEEALNAMRTGGKTLQETSAVAAGTRSAFAQGTRDLNGMKSIRLVHSENVSSRGIERHNSGINKISTYLLAPGEPARYVLVYFNKDGLVADCDVVTK